MKNQNIKYLLFVLVVSLWSSLCLVLPDFWDNPHKGIYGLFVLLVYVGAIGLSHFLLFCFIWYSDSYEQCYPDKIQALQKNRTKHYGTDFLFYSILSAVGIEAQDYDSHRDVFADPINE